MDNCLKHSKYNLSRNMTANGGCCNCVREAAAKKNNPLMEPRQTCQGCGKKGHEGNGTIILCIDKKYQERFLCHDCAITT